MKVKLLKDIGYAGKQHKAGEMIEVADHRLEWLAKQKIIEPVAKSARAAQ